MTAFVRFSPFPAFAVLVLSIQPGQAHEATAGWTYPLECCSNRDCRQVPASQISERPDGYHIAPTGETVGYDDPRLRKSPDGVYHLCAIEGSSHTLCLFVPPSLF